jgi:serine protease Do
VATIRGAEIVLRPVIGETPGTPQIVATALRDGRGQRKDFYIGLNLAPLTEAGRDLLDVPPNISGVIILSIDDDSMFLGSGIRPGDVIESINQQPVSSPADATGRLREILANGQKQVLLLINRHGTNRYLAMSLENNRYDRDAS